MAEADIASRFREACSRFTTGVAVATARTPQGRLEGVTINSFTSVSLHPPMVLFCLDNRAGSFPGFDSAGRFAVNILSSEQQQLCARFASIGMHDQFDGIALESAVDEPPLFPGAGPPPSIRVAIIRSSWERSRGSRLTTAILSSIMQVISSFCDRLLMYLSN